LDFLSSNSHKIITSSSKNKTLSSVRAAQKFKIAELTERTEFIEILRTKRRKVKKWLRERRHKKEKGDDCPKRVM
jgi:hypothetical protein